MSDGDLGGIIGAGITGMVGLGVIGAMSHMAERVERPRKKKVREGERNDNEMLDFLF